MAARSIGSGTISFGLVTIPFKLFTAVSEQKVSFNMLHPCGSRVNQLLRCPACNVGVEHKDLVRGFEHTRDQYVTFTAEELDALKSDRTGASLALEEFVPADSVDLLHIENSYYLGPDKGGDVAYTVLASALARANKLGVGRWAKQGKDVLALVRAYRGGLLLHEAYYANEIRPFDVGLPENVAITPQHVQMAELLIGQLERPAFDASRYSDTWAEKVAAAVEKKLAGEKIVVAPTPKRSVIDLLEALKQSVAANTTKLDDLRAAGPVAKGPKKAAPRKEKAAKKKQRAGE